MGGGAMNERWIHDDQQSKLAALGVWGVDNGLVDIEAVAESRHARLPELMAQLAFRPDDLVVDLGSGMGFVAEAVAPLVNTLYCVDISPSFLEDARARLESKDVWNVEYILTDYADFSKAFTRRVTKIYSLAVFIHFNYYDFLYYLVECNRILHHGGLLYFDFNDGDRFVLQDPTDSFNSHIPLYKRDRKDWIFGCMHMGSVTGLRNMAPQVGFSLEATYYHSTCYTRALLRKVADAPDLELVTTATAHLPTSQQPASPAAQPHLPRRTLRDAIPRPVRRAARRMLPAPMTASISRLLAR